MRPFCLTPVYQTWAPYVSMGITSTLYTFLQLRKSRPQMELLRMLTPCMVEWVLPSKQVAELLPWYMWWSNKLAAEMHCRCHVRDMIHHNVSSFSSRDCSCDSEWQCKPHNTCFIHDSCFCPGSGAFPPVKPLHISLLSHSS